MMNDKNIVIDVQKYINNEKPKIDKKFNVKLDGDYTAKLIKLKSKLNIAEDAKFLRTVIDMLFDSLIIVEQKDGNQNI